MRFHAVAFVVVTVLLWVIDRETAGGPWFHWPVLAWALLLGGHYLYLKSRSVDQAWADERARELRYKSYDLGHIQDIRESQRTGHWAGGDPAKRDE